jgi:hypothetical protein
MHRQHFNFVDWFFSFSSSRSFTSNAIIWEWLICPDKRLVTKEYQAIKQRTAAHWIGPSIQLVELQLCYDLHLPRHKTGYERLSGKEQQLTGLVDRSTLAVRAHAFCAKALNRPCCGSAAEGMHHFVTACAVMGAICRYRSFTLRAENTFGWLNSSCARRSIC